jgi:hypothetical protein
MRGGEVEGQAAMVELPSGEISNGGISALFSVTSKNNYFAKIDLMAPRATTNPPIVEVSPVTHSLVVPHRDKRPGNLGKYLRLTFPQNVWHCYHGGA